MTSVIPLTWKPVETSSDDDFVVAPTIAAAAWVGLPEFRTPTFTVAVLPMFLPAVIALVAENIGHVKSVGQMTGRRPSDRAGVGGRRCGDDVGGLRRRVGDHHPRREHRRDGRDAGVFDGSVLDRGRGDDRIVVVPQGVCGDLGDSSGVLGGATVVLYGLVGVLGVRIWLTTGIALGSIAALLVYHGMRLPGFRTARAHSGAADPAPERR
jgi:hypothetical protein